MATPYLSEIKLFSFNFAPKGWAMCAGQLLPINQNQALFSLLGTTYGGDGRVTFALPDLRSRVPLGAGNAAVLGERAGLESVTLQLDQIPAHTHTIDPSLLTATPRCSSTPANSRTPVGNVPAAEASGVTAVYSNALPDALEANSGLTATAAAAVAGGSAPHENRQPHLALNYCIALQGIFPTPN